MAFTLTAGGGFQFTSTRLSLAAPPETASKLEARLPLMDQRGVDMQVLSLTTPMVSWASPDLGVRLAQAFSDGASAACRAYPKRFLFAAALPIQSADRAQKELDRASQLPGMRAVYLPTSFGGNKELDDKSLWPVYAACEQRGWPVLLHPCETVGRDRTAPYWGLENLAGNPYDTGLAAAHLIFGGVLDAFPKLNVVLPHAGGTLPALIGRWDRGVERRPELKDFKKPATSYLRRFWFDIIAHNDQILTNLIHMAGADRVVLGSDFPFNMGLDEPVKVVERLKLSTREKDLILGGNALTILTARSA
jgi:aminocarboxymuconate-semialdehyde decarboxylase